eukprot:scaffold14783_cov105-Skeletonema_dohrnii-CCMP3373.AAC.2
MTSATAISHHNPAVHTVTSPTPCSIRPMDVCGWPDITVSHPASINICRRNHAINHKPTTALHHASSFTEQRRRKRLRRKDHADGSFNIRYCMDRSVEKNVNRLRITSYNPLVTTARRTEGTDVACPSILAPSYKPQPLSSPLIQPPTPPTSPRGIQHIGVYNTSSFKRI